MHFSGDHIKDVDTKPDEEREAEARRLQAQRRGDCGNYGNKGKQGKHEIFRNSNIIMKPKTKPRMGSDAPLWEAIQCGDTIHIVRAGETVEFAVEGDAYTNQKKHPNKDAGLGQEVVEHLDREIKSITKRLRRLNHEEVISEQWQKLAKILDRMFFVLFLVLFNVFSMAIMLPVVIAKMNPRAHVSVDDGH